MARRWGDLLYAGIKHSTMSYLVKQLSIIDIINNSDYILIQRHVYHQRFCIVDQSASPYSARLADLHSC